MDKIFWGVLLHHFYERHTYIFYGEYNINVDIRGGSRARRGAPPLKLEKIRFFWRKIVIFHTKYPKNFRASLRNWKKIWFFDVKSRFFTRNTQTNFAPPSARRNFFKCAPPNLKSWIRPWIFNPIMYTKTYTLINKLINSINNDNCW